MGKQMEMLRKKDEDEENARNKLRDQAAQELADWYAQNTIRLEKLRTANRAAMENTDKNFIAQIEPIQPGTEHEQNSHCVLTSSSSCFLVSNPISIYSILFIFSPSVRSIVML